MKMPRDTFYFPYRCRRDHRAHTWGLVAGFLLVFIAALLLPSPMRGAEVEATVIDEAFIAWNESEEASVEDLADIYMDTDAGSECEKFSAATFYIATVVSEVLEWPEDYVPSPIEMAENNVVGLLYNDYGPLYNNCMNEE